MTLYRVAWRRADSVYASTRTTFVNVDSVEEVPAAVAEHGHHEERPLQAADVNVRGALRVIDLLLPGANLTASAVVEHLAPWEELAYVPNESYRESMGPGFERRTRFFARLVYPSTAYCVACDCDASDAVAPWSLGITTRDGRSVTVARNIGTHLDGHLTGEQLKRDGAARDFIVYPDRIG